MKDVIARFLPKFKRLAEARLVELTAIAHERDSAKALSIARDLHSLAGEAGLLGLTSIVQIARTCERLAKQHHASHSDTDSDALLAALSELGGAIDLVPLPQPSTGGT